MPVDGWWCERIDWSSFDNREVLDDELGRFISTVGGAEAELPQPDDPEGSRFGFLAACPHHFREYLIGRFHQLDSHLFRGFVALTKHHRREYYRQTSSNYRK